MLKQFVRAAYRRLATPREVEALELAALDQLAALQDQSYAGEWKQLSSCLTRLGIASGFVADIAASNGVTASSTLPLFRDHAHWSGFAIEMQAAQFARLAFVYSAFPNAHLARGRVTPKNVASLLDGHEVPRDFEVLNLDIDSYDLPVMQAMFDGGFRPKVVTMEINEKLPPPIHFSVLYNDDHYWRGDHFYGCSLTAASEAMRGAGYMLVGLEYNNALFVQSELARGLFEDLDDAQAYNAGYRDRPDRSTLFPWNDDVNSALTMSPNEAMRFFAEHFRVYEGSYELRVASTDL